MDKIFDNNWAQLEKDLTVVKNKPATIKADKRSERDILEEILNIARENNSYRGLFSTAYQPIAWDIKPSGPLLTSSTTAGPVVVQDYDWLIKPILGTAGTPGTAGTVIVSKPPTDHVRKVEQTAITVEAQKPENKAKVKTSQPPVSSTKSRGKKKGK